MKQSLDLRIGQHLTITPQLQQAIRLLQLSALELQQEVQAALETNPLLEEIEERDNEADREDGEATSEQATDEQAAVDRETAATESNDANETSEASDANDAGDEAPVTEASASDEDWENTFDTPAPGTDRPDHGEAPDIDARNSSPITLRDHLAWQMQMTSFSERDKAIATAILDCINEDGYLTSSLEDVLAALHDADTHANFELDEVEAVLHQIQNFDPLGVGSCSLAECLLLQMRALDPATPHLAHAQRLATEDALRLLAARDFRALRRNLKIPPEDLQGAIDLIQTLNPRPGGSVASAHAAYIAPDVVVRKVRGVWRVDLNGTTTPRVRINAYYEGLLRRGNGNGGPAVDGKYLQDRLQEARWFIKSLNSRNDTLLKVARMIVDRQRAFFDHGPEAMKPLVLHDIASAVEMHESTISRVTSHKYILTPRGIFELKYFFSSHVGTADGGTCSATAIREIIRKLVDTETTTKPISDNRIAELLSQQGIHVARRTVAKYREAMNIPPSSQRKSMS